MTRRYDPGFPVTDPHLDAPDGAIVDGYIRCDTWWRPALASDYEDARKEAADEVAVE